MAVMGLRLPDPAWPLFETQLGKLARALGRYLAVHNELEATFRGTLRRSHLAPVEAPTMCNPVFRPSIVSI